MGTGEKWFPKIGGQAEHCLFKAGQDFLFIKIWKISLERL